MRFERLRPADAYGVEIALAAPSRVASGVGGTNPQLVQIELYGVWMLIATEN